MIKPTDTPAILAAAIRARQANEEAGRAINDLVRQLGAGDFGSTFSLLPPAGKAEPAIKRDLDGPYDDPEVRVEKLKGWDGPSCKGRHYSECPPKFLQRLAGFLEWAANESEKKGEVTSSGKSIADFKRLDAARARGWAERIMASGGAGRHRTRPAAEVVGALDHDNLDADGFAGGHL